MSAGAPSFLWPPIVSKEAAEVIDTLYPVNAVMHAHHLRNINVRRTAPAIRDLLANCATPLDQLHPSTVSSFATKTPGSSFDQLSVNCNPIEKVDESPARMGALSDDAVTFMLICVECLSFFDALAAHRPSLNSRRLDAAAQKASLKSSNEMRGWQ
jgi:hypothetical protein